MDTKEKNREASRQDKAREEQRSRIRERSAKAGEKNSSRKREQQAKATASQSRQTRQRREQTSSQQPAQTRQRPAQAQTARKPRQTEAQRRPSAQQSAASRRRTEQDQIPYSAPQGTGPRKSAPQPSAAEAASLRRRQQTQTKVVQEPEKKNALQNFISGIKGEPAPTGAAAKSEKRRKERSDRAEKQRRQAQRYDTPTVIYTQPQAFSRDRLLLQLLSVTAVVAAVVIGMSLFFKVEVIEVAGADTYDTSTVVDASGIAVGDGLLTFSKPRAAAKIHAELSYVDDVRIGIKLPNKVIIYVKEVDVSYSIASNQGDWWLINSEGKVVDQLGANLYSNYTQVLGVVLEDPQIGNAAVAADEVPQETLASGEPVPVTVTGAQRLSSALQILKALEANDIVGQAASVDVSALDDVVLWYGSRYEVLLGDTARMEYKIACMNDAILQMSDYESGILDISFTHWADKVGYTPFG